MTPYLYTFAGNLPQIRERLGFSQADLAQKSGISKPTIVSIESDPRRLSKSQAMAFFLVIHTELDSRKRAINSADTADTAKTIGTLVAAGFSAKVLQTLLPRTVPLIGLSTGLIGAFATYALLPQLLKSFKGDPEQVRDKIPPELTGEMVKKVATGSLVEIEKDLKLLMGLDTLTPHEFMQKIADAEVGV